MASLWDEVVSALHPKAVVSVVLMVSKCNSTPVSRLISRDVSDPSLCPVAAIAFWSVLVSISADDVPFFSSVVRRAFPEARLVMRLWPLCTSTSQHLASWTQRLSAGSTFMAYAMAGPPVRCWEGRRALKRSV